VAHARSIAAAAAARAVRAAESGRAAKSGHAAQVRARRAREAPGMNTLTEAQRERVLAMLREGKTLRRIEAETGHRRETVAAYGRRAGLLDGEVAELGPREPASVCEPHHDAIEDALASGASLRAVHAELVERFAFPGSYSTLKRYVRARIAAPRDGAMMLAA
jgi:DNA-binding CsgD family transcriptional regulator